MTAPNGSRLLLLILVPMLLGGGLALFILFRPDGNTPAPTPAEPLPVLAVLPDFTLTDQSGKEFGLEQLLGKAWVGTFIFTRCQQTCPTQTADMVQLQTKLQASPHRDQIHLVSVSVDSEHDTPAVLNRYASQNGADTTRWHFLTGPADDVRALGESGFKLPVTGGTAPGTLGHSPHLVLVDRWGQVRGYYDGMSPEAVGKLGQDLERVVLEDTPPAVHRAETAAKRDPTQAFVDDGSWLRPRQREQVGAAKEWKVFHDFHFSDRLYRSGITFRNLIVDDAARYYKAAHYDHGTGLAVADVDGDGLVDVYFVNQAGPSELWRNLGGGKFENVTAGAGLELKGVIGVTASFADVNNDGAPDLYVTTVRGGNRLFLNDGKGHFTDATAASGLGLNGHFSAALFFDYDRDGLVDLFLCEVGKYTTDQLLPVTPPLLPPGESVKAGHGEYQYYEAFKDAFSGHLHPERRGKCLLLRNTGNARFADVTDQVGLGYTGWSGDATTLDANGDGWPDLYVLNMQGHDEYFENQGGKKFVRKSREVFPKTPWGSMGVRVFDWNNDGILDLLVTDMHSDMSKDVKPEAREEKRKSDVQWPESYLRSEGKSIFGNALFQGEGNGKFQEVSDSAGAETYWPWGPSVGDLNADGYQDVFVTAGMGFPFRYGINSLLLNDGGRRFRDSEFVLGVEPRRGWRTSTPWYKIDSASPEAPPFARGRRGEVTVWGTLSSRGSAIFDLDNDGDLDIVTNEFNAEPMILVSNLSERKTVHFLKVRLVGGMKPSAAPADGPAAQSNRDGLGATVRVRCGSQSYLQVNDGKSGYLSQSSLPLYFGLGDAGTVDAVEVHWPSGRKQTIPGPLPANQLLMIEEPTTSVRP